MLFETPYRQRRSFSSFGFICILAGIFFREIEPEIGNYGVLLSVAGAVLIISEWVRARRQTIQARGDSQRR